MSRWPAAQRFRRAIHQYRAENRHGRRATDLAGRLDALTDRRTLRVALVATDDRSDSVAQPDASAPAAIRSRFPLVSYPVPDIVVPFLPDPSKRVGDFQEWTGIIYYYDLVDDNDNDPLAYIFGATRYDRRDSVAMRCVGCRSSANHAGLVWNVPVASQQHCARKDARAVTRLVRSREAPMWATTPTIHRSSRNYSIGSAAG